MKKILLVISFLLASNNSFAGPLEGKIREAFIKTFDKSCLDTQTKMPVNDGLSPSILLKYCHCNAEMIADAPNASTVIPAIGRHDMPITTYSALMQHASEYCAKQLLKDFVSK